MLFSRETGVLLHPTSLPGPWGTGTLGAEAEGFIRWMADSGLSVWQVLPISPPVYGHSPYQTLSSFAINPILLSPEKLLSRGLLLPEEADRHTSKARGRVNWKTLGDRKYLLEKAARRAIDNNPEFPRFSAKTMGGGMEQILNKKGNEPGKTLASLEEQCTSPGGQA